jgi:hypothetical protein
LFCGRCGFAAGMVAAADGGGVLPPCRHLRGGWNVL